MSQDVATSLSAGRYRLVAVLGEGGMATVYSAYDERLGVHRAIKLLTPALAHHSGLRRRFEAEARTTARLHHKHIVTVHDVGSDGDRSYMVLELVGGGSLMARLDALGPMPPRMASEVMQAILSALQYAHERGVIHRDIKPHNILIDLDGTPKLTDFGIARVMANEQSLTRTGAAIGTPAYMAPEQRGNASQVDARADLFSAGATLYALVTGREPYDLYARELHDHLFSDVPGPIGAVIRNATRYNPGERYASAAAMLADLRSIAVALDPDPPDTLPLGAPLPAVSVAMMARADHTSDEGISTPAGLTHPEDPEEDIRSGVTVAPPLDEEVADIETPLEAETPSLGMALRSPRFWGLIALGLLASVGMVATLVYWEGRTPVAVADPPAPVVATHTEAPPDPPPIAPTAPPEVAPTPPAAQPETAPTPVTPPAHTATKSVAMTPIPPVPEAPKTTVPPTRPTTQTKGTEPATTPTSGSGMGQLTVSSKPKADIFLDNRFQGRRLSHADLTPGTYHVVLESEDDGRKEVDLSVRPGEETRYCWDFKAAATCAH